MSTLTDLYHALPVQRRPQVSSQTAGRRLRQKVKERLFKFPDGHTVKAKARK